MAKLSANGIEVCRLERPFKTDERGTFYLVLSIRSNGVTLQATRLIFQGKPTTSRWKVHLTRKAAHTIELRTPDKLREYYLAKGFNRVN